MPINARRCGSEELEAIKLCAGCHRFSYVHERAVKNSVNDTKGEASDAIRSSGRWNSLHWNHRE